MKSGRYQTASEPVREALRLLDLREQQCDQTFREVKSKLARGVAEAERGELLDGDEIFDELRDMIEERRRAKAVKP
ncbi:MAG: type II toxin-antitoxin system ParD family antitoxin [Bryobacterales bacterium]|nr:type II toxin-antitoxin system ParD family antitoxin [Bryobacterales bacterium]